MSAMSLPSPLPPWALASDDFKFETVANKILIMRARAPSRIHKTREFMNSPALVLGNSGLVLTDWEQSVNLLGSNVNKIFPGFEAFCRQE